MVKEMMRRENPAAEESGGPVLETVPDVLQTDRHP
jgi:hypothetical protein